MPWCPFAVWDSQCSRHSDCGDGAKRYEKEKQQWDEVGNESKDPSSFLFFPNLKRTDGKLLLLEISKSLKKSKSQNC